MNKYSNRPKLVPNKMHLFTDFLMISVERNETNSKQIKIGRRKLYYNGYMLNVYPCMSQQTLKRY